MPIGKNLIYLPTCQSTNTHLAEISQSPALPEGTTVYTFHQTAGRGQRGNAWESQPNQNLTFSYLLYAKEVPLEQMFILSMATALGVYDFLQAYLPTEWLHIKYPNDILVKGEKIGGILIENSLKGESIEKTIMGIGLNINQLDFQYPRATSLCLHTKQTHQLENCLQELLTCLANQYELLKEKNYFQIKANFLAKSFQFNELCTYFTESGEMSGKIIDIDLAGVLHVETPVGVKTFGTKEISFFPPSELIT